MTGDFQSISLSASVAQAASVMLKNRSSELVVINGDLFVGLIPYTSLIKTLQKNITEYPAIDLIKEDVITLPPDKLIMEFVHSIQPKQQSIYPVVKENKLLGVITDTDLNNFLLDRQALLRNKD